MQRFFDFIRISAEKVGLKATVIIVALACLLCGSFMEFRHEPRLIQVENSIVDQRMEMDSIKMLLKVQNAKLDLLIGMLKK